MSARPRPRAKPKAKAAEAPQQAPSPVAQSAEANSSPSTSTPSGTAKHAAQREITDSFFMKNTQTDKWIQMNAQREAARLKASKKTQEAPEVVPDDDDDDDESSGSKRRRRIQKSRGSGRSADDWTNDMNAIQSFDIDSDVEVLSQSIDRDRSSSKRLKSDSTAVNDERGRAKEKNRKRSPSLTPPPALDMLDRLKARLAVNDIYGRREVQPVDSYSALDRDDDDSFNLSIDTSSSNLAPELAAIAKSVKSRGTGADTSASTSQSFLEGDPWSGALVGTTDTTSPSSDTVFIKVTLIRRPETAPAGGKNRWAFQLKRDAIMVPLFQSVSHYSGIPTSQLVMRYDSKQVFQSSSPSLLKMKEEVEVEVYDKTTWEHIRRQPGVGLPSSGTVKAQNSQNRAASSSKQAPSQNDGDDDDDDQDTAANDSFVSSTSAAPPVEEQRIKLLLRSQKYPDKKVSVLAKPTTLASTLVTQYLKSVGLGEMSDTERQKRRIRLVVDGDDVGDEETVEEIGDGILEDGDVIDVHGL